MKKLLVVFGFILAAHCVFADEPCSEFAGEYLCTPLPTEDKTIEILPPGQTFAEGFWDGMGFDRVRYGADSWRVINGPLGLTWTGIKLRDYVIPLRCSESGLYGRTSFSLKENAFVDRDQIVSLGLGSNGLNITVVDRYPPSHDNDFQGLERERYTIDCDRI